MAAMLPILTAAGLAGGFSAVLALVVSQIRQRSAATEEEAPVEDVSDSTTNGHIGQGPPPRRRASFGRGSPSYVVFLMVAAVLYYLYQQKGSYSGRSLQYRQCTAPPSAAERLKLFPNLYGFHHAVSTHSLDAQALFDLGLLLAWNYDQPEAEATFRLGLEADPNAAMLHWGIQQVIGPGANRAVLPVRPDYPAFAPDNFQTVRSLSQKAFDLAQKALAAEPESSVAKRDAAFAHAAVLRWPEGSAFGERRDAAELQYSAALQKFGEEHKDAAALALSAEALLNLHPWEYYLPNGSMKATAEKAEALLRVSLSLDADNPLANHLIIHISEASSSNRDAPLSAHRGVAAANRMAFGKGPWSANQGHLLHMPSHTFLRVGRYSDAVQANVNAYNADLMFGSNCMSPFEPEHNTDMLIFAASMNGQVKIAEEFALKVREYGKAMFFEGPAQESQNWAKHPLFLAHFARWGDVMKLQKPDATARGNCPSGGQEFAMVVWRYVRSLALAAKAQALKLSGEGEGFQQTAAYLQTYLQLLREAEELVEAEEQTLPPAVYMCEYKGLAQIFVLMAEAKADILREDYKLAATKLQKAVEIEASFAYMEPPRVYQPVRQCLGYVLLLDGRLEEAIEVYKEDLVVYPENGWSLHGLSEAYHRQFNFVQVDKLKPRYEKVWKAADVQIESSCIQFSKPWGEV